MKRLLLTIYAKNGRKSIDSVVLIKMLLIGYLYGIKFERRLEEEVSLNLAYRWFCDIDLMQKVPDHSIFSQNRKRRFKDAGIFREIFNEIVLLCIKQDIVSGEVGVADGSFLPSNVSWNSRYEAVESIQHSTIKYMDELDADLSAMPGYSEPEEVETEKKYLKSHTDPDCGYIHQERKTGLGYLVEMTIDTKYGIITGVDCYPANKRESDIISDCQRTPIMQQQNRGSFRYRMRMKQKRAVFHFHIASFFRFMAAYLSFTHIPTI